LNDDHDRSLTTLVTLVALCAAFVTSVRGYGGWLVMVNRHQRAGPIHRLRFLCRRPPLAQARRWVLQSVVHTWSAFRRQIAFMSAKQRETKTKSAPAEQLRLVRTCSPDHLAYNRSRAGGRVRMSEPKLCSWCDFPHEDAADLEVASTDQTLRTYSPKRAIDMRSSPCEFTANTLLPP
jgi:hypothetical protein